MNLKKFGGRLLTGLKFAFTVLVKLEDAHIVQIKELEKVKTITDIVVDSLPNRPQ